MGSKQTQLEVLERVQENNVKFVRLQFTDIFGALKNVAITVEDLPRVLEEGMLFDASAVGGIACHLQSDMVLRPDPTTFVVFPWRPRDGAVARLLCDLHTPEGQPFPLCSRWVLRRVLEEACGQGIRFLVAAEAEFFLFQLDDRGHPTTVTHDLASFCDLTPVDLGENARRDMVLTLQEMGIGTASSHHELGPGQHEIALRLTEALQAADQLVTFKFVVRTIAQRHGLHASFMPTFVRSKRFRPQPRVAGLAGGPQPSMGSLWRVGAECGRTPFCRRDTEACSGCDRLDQSLGELL